MFNIKIDYVMEECNNLENQVSKLFEQMLELENVLKILGSYNSLGEPASGLKEQLQCMDEEYNSLRRLMQALGKISLYYNNCENRVCDNEEQSAIHYPKQKVGVWEIEDWIEHTMFY